MSEGGLGAPTRHPLDWQNPDFYDEAKLDAETRRVFDICHGCRRCFNLCDSFPRLFDLIDAAPNGELDTVDSQGFKPVVDACTLCDMCFMTKYPYVPSHAAPPRGRGQPGQDKDRGPRTRRNGKAARFMAPLANWVTGKGNKVMRGIVEKVTGLDKDAELPKYQSKSFEKLSAGAPPEVNHEAPAHGRKAVIYATCFPNYNDLNIGLAARAVLAKNGVATQILHPHCCGMPMLEQGNIAEVAKAARIVAQAMRPWIDKGYGIIA